MRHVSSLAFYDIQLPLMQLLVGSFLFTLEALTQQTPITITPADDTPQALEIKAFVESCLDDMSHTTTEFLSDVLSMVWAGFAWHEVVYKIRRGPDAELSMLRSELDPLCIRRLELLRGSKRRDLLREIIIQETSEVQITV